MKKKDRIARLTGKHLRQQRLEKNMTMEQVSSDTNMDSDNLGRIERGEQGPSNPTLFKLRAYTGIDLNRVYDAVKRDLEMEKEDED